MSCAWVGWSTWADAFWWGYVAGGVTVVVAIVAVMWFINRQGPL